MPTCMNSEEKQAGWLTKLGKSSASISPFLQGIQVKYKVNLLIPEGGKISQMDRKTSLAEHTMVTFLTVGACGLPQVYCLFQLPSPRTPGTAAGNFAGMIGRTRVSRQLLRLSLEIPPNSRKQQGPLGWLHHLLPTPTLPHERPMPPETRCPGTDS